MENMVVITVPRWVLMLIFFPHSFLWLMIHQSTVVARRRTHWFFVMDHSKKIWGGKGGGGGWPRGRRWRWSHGVWIVSRQQKDPQKKSVLSSRLRGNSSRDESHYPPTVWQYSVRYTACFITKPLFAATNKPDDAQSLEGQAAWTGEIAWPGFTDWHRSTFLAGFTFPRSMHNFARTRWRRLRLCPYGRAKVVCREVSIDWVALRTFNGVKLVPNHLFSYERCHFACCFSSSPSSKMSTTTRYVLALWHAFERWEDCCRNWLIRPRTPTWDKGVARAVRTSAFFGRARLARSGPLG